MAPKFTHRTKSGTNVCVYEKSVKIGAITLYPFDDLNDVATQIKYAMDEVYKTAYNQGAKDVRDSIKNILDIGD